MHDTYYRSSRRLSSQPVTWLHYNQLTSKVDGGITGSRLGWLTLTECVTPQSGNRVSTSLGNSGLCWTVFTWNRDTAVPAEGNGDLQTLICVLVARPRRCLKLSNHVPWQNWMAAYLGYTLRMKTLFRGWRVMVHDTHMRRRRHDWCNTSLPNQSLGWY